jgi:hypothetical protein
VLAGDLRRGTPLVIARPGTALPSVASNGRSAKDSIDNLETDIDTSINFQIRGGSMAVRKARPYTVIMMSLALSVAALILGPPTSAHGAIAQCGTPPINNQIGWDTGHYPSPQPAGGIEGSSSFIITRASALCQTDGNPGVNFSTSWNMIYGPGGNAQAGTMYRYGWNCTIAWAEQTLGANFTDYNSGCVTGGSTHAYRNRARGIRSIKTRSGSFRGTLRSLVRPGIRKATSLDQRRRRRISLPWAYSCMTTLS